MKAPFPWFGGKSRAAPLIWERLGTVPNYCEPFAGSLAVLLGRPHPPGLETVNDKDAFVCNVWRALHADPDAVAHYADGPANESDLHARHVWLRARRKTLTARLEGDPDYCDAKLAGWWLWGISLWIGGGWCGEGANGPWQVVEGQLVNLGGGGRGVTRRLLHLGNAGCGVTRKRLHLGQGGSAMGVHQLAAAGEGLRQWFGALQSRLRRVRVCCGDWTRVMGYSVLDSHGVTGVVLDPPYSHDERDTRLYDDDDDPALPEQVRQWAIAHGENPSLRIVLCGYESAHYTMPETWEKVSWSPIGGYANSGHGRGRENKHREVLWFSPHCLPPEQPRLF